MARPAMRDTAGGTMRLPAGGRAPQRPEGTPNMASNSRAHIHVADSFGPRAADAIARGMGSWAFIIAQTVLVLVWVALNLAAVLAHWDPYPFILLNLLFSTQAAYAAPIIMMSQNRQAYKDHLRDDHEADEVDLLFKINRQQLEILYLLRRRLLSDADAAPPLDEGLRAEIDRMARHADEIERALGVEDAGA